LTESGFEDGSVSKGTTYYYVVRAENGSGEESQSSIELTVTPGETSVQPIESLQEFKLFPNPASELCTVQFSIEEQSSVVVSMFDLSGRELHKFVENENWVPGDHTLRLPLNGFQTGTYVLKVMVNQTQMKELLMIE